MTATLNDLYPQGPEGVPADLTDPTPAYTRHARIAFGGLLGFVGLYLGLTAWFGYVAFRLVMDGVLAGGDEWIMGALLALPPTFLFAFLVRGLFFTKHDFDDGRIEITEQDEPLLYAFVHRIADEAGAPRPHRVFLSSRVNAAVFYDLSFRNLIIPSKKNLEIGLGLVETVSLDELKAVMAHEFGHFAQRTMAVGRWVYVAQQIAGHVVATRGKFDGFLEGMSRIDLRVAWIAWIMRLVVWAIRAVLETAFRLIVLAERALSREMERQADLVAVSLSGSDSLVHALHRLGAADDAWNRAAQFSQGQLGKWRKVEDFFAIQTRILERMRDILDDPEHGTTPSVPDGDRAGHRVFTQDLAAPPQMWSTHPPNHEREANAKARYFPSSFDSRSPWALFKDPDALRRRMTAKLLDRAITGDEMLPPENPPEEVPLADSLEEIDEQFDRPVLARRYRGSYLGRSVVRCAERVDELYEPVPDDEAGVRSALAALYPASLSETLERNRELAGEVAMLGALKDGILEAPGGVIRFRGEEVPRKQLAEVIERARDESKAAEAVVLAHDRRVRTAHRAAARRAGPGWESHLVGLCELLHYFDHTAADIEDAAGVLGNVFQIVIADGRVSGGERKRLVNAAETLHLLLEDLWTARGAVRLGDAVAAELEAESWAKALPDTFELLPPSEGNIGDWLDVHQSWVGAFLGALNAAGRATLTCLLAAEDTVRGAFENGEPPGDAPEAAKVPERYRRLVPGDERERQTQLGWWDRFVTADGVGPGALRFVVAAAVLAPAFVIPGASSGGSHATVVVHNGLAMPVSVLLGETRTHVGPGDHRFVQVLRGEQVPVSATAEGAGLVDELHVDIDSGRAHFIYNVASAAPLLEWTAAYGSAAEVDPRHLGTPRWTTSRADFIFVEPPAQIQTSGSGGTRTVLQGMGDQDPRAQYFMVDDPTVRTAMAMTHVRLDPVNSDTYYLWAAMASEGAEFPAALQARIESGGNDVVLLRMEQDLLDRDAACARHRELAAAAPDDVSLRYATARCIDDEGEQAAAFQSGLEANPEHGWFTLATGYGYSEQGEWAKARELLDRLPKLLPSHAGLFARDIVRVRRMAAEGADPDLSDLVAAFPEVAAVLSIETGALVDESLRPRERLEAGALDEALAAAGEDVDLRAELVRLVAASDGAGKQHRAEVAALTLEDGMTPGTWAPTLGRAARRGEDPGPLRELGAALLGDKAADRLVQITAALAKDGDAEAFEEAMRGLPPKGRGLAYVAGITALQGEDTPKGWRRTAKRLLLPGERPYYE